MRDLALGLWSSHRTGTEQQKKRLRIPLATTRCSPQVWILWQVNVALDHATKSESQLVKVWAIGSKSDVSCTIDSVIVLQKTYSTERVAQCCWKPLEDTEKKTLPRLFTGPQEDAKRETNEQTVDARTVDRDVLEMANRFYTLTKPLIRTVSAKDPLAEFPFHLSREETRPVLHLNTPSLILGRSGTGKTTCLVFKLLAKYMASFSLPRERPQRPVLLTRSSELADKLRDYLHGLMRTMAMGPSDQRDLTEWTLPLLDAKDDKNQCSDFFELRDGDFPLVCTFDRFLELLGNTIKKLNHNVNVDEDTLEMGAQVPQLPDLDNDTRAIDFHAFMLDYWPSLPKHLTKTVPAELAFAEILGTIKGSLFSRETLKPLSRKEYLGMSCRVAPTFDSIHERACVYDIFETYQKLKARRRGSDGVDRVVKLIQPIRKIQRLRTFLGDAFDEFYVDEVQDLRCLDVELLLSMVKDSCGFHFAGDTAQTISFDSHFRFDDIKALFYKHFTAAASFINKREIARPELFHLAENYRSHQGILGLASFVMRMLWSTFPETIDKLTPEVGQIHGPIPVFFLGCEAGILASNDVHDSNQDKLTMDFGAEQVVIVRDQDTKVKLNAALRDKALVLTILQSKGMEFEDVFLWNFFTDTLCPGGWRALCTLWTASGHFDAKKHTRMCSELKHLYVAITRARIRLSIVESEGSLAAQVAGVLKQDQSSPLVEVTNSSNPDFIKELVSLRSIKHDPERWSARGQEFMQRRQYDDAAICFRRAKDKCGETCANAYISEERGRRFTSAGKTEAARVSFRDAVQKFMELEMVPESSRNFESLGEFREAALLWARHQISGRAAPLFARAGMLQEASDHYHRACSYEEAAEALRQGQLAESLVSYVTQNRQNLNPRSLRSHGRFCALLVKQKKLQPSRVASAVELLGSPAEKEKAFIEYEMHDRLTNLYGEQRRYKERFLYFVRIGELDHAVNGIDDLDTGDSRSLAENIRMVQDYRFAGQILCFGGDSVGNLARHRALCSNWKTAERLMARAEGDHLFEQVENMDDGIVKGFLQVHTILDLRLFEKVSTLERLPFKAILKLARIADMISSHRESTLFPVILLRTGVVEVDHETKPFTLLPWSPLCRTAADFNADEYPRLANQWFLDTLGGTILAFDSVLRKRHRLQWPVRCAKFLTQEFCHGSRDRSCPHLHEKVKSVDIKRKLSFLMDVCIAFCSLTAVHRKNIMDRTFQESFSGLRRYWLESLLRELVFVSSFEQSSRVVAEVRSKIRRNRQSPQQDRGLSVLAANIEDLLFHRLGKDWIERNDLSSLIEQIQASQLLGKHYASIYGRR